MFSLRGGVGRRGLQHRRTAVRVRVAIVALAIGAAGIMALSIPPVSATEPSQITIDNFTFAPATLTVAVGATVTWINRDDIPHTVRAENGSFRSNALDTEDRYSHQFTVAGQYRYFCSLHPHMTGEVIVQE